MIEDKTLEQKTAEAEARWSSSETQAQDEKKVELVESAPLRAALQAIESIQQNIQVFGSILEQLSIATKSIGFNSTTLHDGLLETTNNLNNRLKLLESQNGGTPDALILPRETRDIPGGGKEELDFFQSAMVRAVVTKIKEMRESNKSREGTVAKNKPIILGDSI